MCSVMPKIRTQCSELGCRDLIEDQKSPKYPHQTIGLCKIAQPCQRLKSSSSLHPDAYKADPSLLNDALVQLSGIDGVQS